MIKPIYYFFVIISLFTTIFLLLLFHIEWFEALSISIFVYFILKFTNDLGESLSIKNIIAIVACIQYLLGAVLGYAFDEYVSYKMAILKAEYFSYVLPSIIFFFMGLYWPINKKKMNVTFNFNKPDINYYQKGRTLIVIGFIASFLQLNFVGFILSGLKYVGLFYMFNSKNIYKYFWIILVISSLVLSVLISTMFHELILWGCFSLMIFFILKRTVFITRFAVITLGIIIIIGIQLIKKDYRSDIANNNLESSNVEIFIQNIENKFLNNEGFFSTEDIGYNISRINQGWIISNVLSNVPEYEPYARGKTIIDAIVASIFPRFLMPNKVVANGHENMLRFAGVNLKEGTAMDIGYIGESYANFGYGGGIIFMLIFGLFINGIITFIERQTMKYPDLIFWIPLIFLQAIKAETDIAIILNHITKTLIITWFFFSPFIRKILRTKFIFKN